MSQYLEIKYEDLVKSPLSIFKKETEFSELPWNKHFETRLKRYKLQDMNYKWKKNLTLHQQNILKEVLDALSHNKVYRDTKT